MILRTSHSHGFLRGTLGIIGLSALLLNYQNCAKVDLVESYSVETLSAQGSLDLCLEPNETLNSVIVSNLSIAFDQNGIGLDSDQDGLTDRREIQLGLNPFNPRTYGLLDRVCLNLSSNARCENMCNSQEEIWLENELGLNACDKNRIVNSYSVSEKWKGIDSDQDGIPDILEVIRNTQPLVNDLLFDYDGDQIQNVQEYQRGTNPRWSNNSISYQPLYSVTSNKKTANTCLGDLWEIRIHDLAIVTPREALAIPQHSFFYRDVNQNTVLIAIHTHLGSKPRLYVTQKYVSFDQPSLDLRKEDFRIFSEDD